MEKKHIVTPGIEFDVYLDPKSGEWEAFPPIETKCCICNEEGCLEIRGNFFCASHFIEQDGIAISLGWDLPGKLGLK